MLIKIKSKINIFDMERAPAYLSSLSEKGLIPVKYKNFTGTLCCRKEEPKKLKYVYDYKKCSAPVERDAYLKERKEAGYSLLYDEYNLYIFYGDIDALDLILTMKVFIKHI